MNITMKLGTIVTLGIASLLPAWSAGAYPTKPVRMIIGNPPGGPSDLSLRGIAEILTRSTGQPFVVENRPGADGMIAGEACARAAPDGHTICMADSFNTALNPSIHSKMTYSPTKDLAPVIHTGFLPSGFWVNQGVSAKSARELLDQAKAKPGTMNWASFGTASSSTLYVAWLKNEKGIDFANIPYKTALDAWKAVLAGESHISIYGLRAGIAQAQGQARPLAVNTDSRMPDLPDVPTFREAGIDTVIITWFGLFVPAATPTNIIQQLNGEISKGLFQTPEMKQKYLDGMGLLVYGPAGRQPAAFADFIKDETQMYANLVKVTKVKVAE
jgi:tripartite-type tricarboxylate transporter receptor subunit TctC